MKKIFTFLFCTVIISSAFSQADKQYAFNKNSNPYYQTSYNHARYERDNEINKVNYFNNIRVQQLVNDVTFNIWQKRDALNALESQRIQKINSIYAQYSDAVAASTNRQFNNLQEMKRQEY